MTILSVFPAPAFAAEFILEVPTGSAWPGRDSVPLLDLAPLRHPNFAPEGNRCPTPSLERLFPGDVVVDRNPGRFWAPPIVDIL